MTGINLQNGCELWATFDTEDVDSNRGIVRDRSGHGRTLEASGGPTYGQASPVGEAVGVDGTDDEFISVQSDDFDIPLDGGVTVHILLRSGTDQSLSGNGPHIVSTAEEKATGNRDGWKTNVDGNNRFQIGVEDTNDNVEVLSATGKINDNIWHNCTGVYDLANDRLVAIRDDNVSVLNSLSVNANVEATQPLRIGRGVTGSFYAGDIGFVGVWSRVLSDAEINQLNRMTDRMVSRL